MADLANEGRGGAVGGQLTAGSGQREAQRPKAQGMSPQECRSPVRCALTARRGLQAPPIAPPQAGLAGLARHPR